MEYKDTLNLPKTDFPMKANLPNREPIFSNHGLSTLYFKKHLINQKNQKNIYFMMDHLMPMAIYT